MGTINNLKKDIGLLQEILAKRNQEIEDLKKAITKVQDESDKRCAELREQLKTLAAELATLKKGE